MVEGGDGNPGCEKKVQQGCAGGGSGGCKKYIR